VLHGDLCIAGCKARTNFADESVYWTAWWHYILWGGNLFIICQQWGAVISSIGRFFSVTISEQCVLSWRSVLYGNMYLCMTPTWNMYLLESVQRKCWCKFRDERLPSRQTIYNYVNKLRTRLLTDKKQNYKQRVLTEDKLDGIGAKLDHTPWKSLICLSQETEASNSSAWRVTKLLKLRPYKTTVIHVLQPCDPAIRVHFCSWFLQPVIESEIHLQLTFFSDETWFHLQGYINMENNRY
jgi:hypothetical protein